MLVELNPSDLRQTVKASDTDEAPSRTRGQSCPPESQPDLSLKRFREFSSALYAALKDGVLVWLAALPTGQANAWQARFGRGTVRRVGPQRDGQVPLAIKPSALALELVKPHSPEREEISASLHGVDTLRIPRAHAAKLSDAGVPIRHRSAVSRILRNPNFFAYLIVLVYSALRALPVTFVPEFQGSLLMLWAIDLITAIPYTWGLLAAITGKNLPVRITGMVVTVVTFVAPYVYFWWNGDDYPPLVVAVVIALIVSGILLEVVKAYRTKRIAGFLKKPPARSNTADDALSKQHVTDRQLAKRKSDRQSAHRTPTERQSAGSKPDAPSAADVRRQAKSSPVPRRAGSSTH